MEQKKKKFVKKKVDKTKKKMLLFYNEFYIMFESPAKKNVLTIRAI